MKYVCVILDGACDRPLPDLNGLTPLMAATGEHLKAMARKARVGVVQPLPPDWDGDPEAALISLFGYDPRRCWPRDFGFYVEQNEAFYRSREKPWKLGITVEDG